MPGRDDYVKFFEAADKDASGTLTLDELVEALKTAGYRGTDAQLKGMFHRADTSGDNILTMDEFLVAMGEQSEETHTTAQMLYIFRSFDENNDGTIDASEMKKVILEMRKVVSDKEIDRIMTIMDKNGDGAIDYQEFLDYYGYGEDGEAEEKN